MSEWINDVGFGLGPLIFLLFPTGRPPTTAWRPMVWFAGGMAGLAAVVDALRPGPLVNFPFVDNPLGVPSSIALDASNGMAISEVLLFVVGAASVFVRFTTAHGTERQQIKWFAYAALLIAITIVPVLIVPEMLGLNRQQLPPWCEG